MRCGGCKQSFPNMAKLREHWGEKKCRPEDDVWKRYRASRKRGHSGRRILREAYPALYPTKPMPDEVKDRLRGGSP